MKKIATLGLALVAGISARGSIGWNAPANANSGVPYAVRAEIGGVDDAWAVLYKNGAPVASGEAHNSDWLNLEWSGTDAGNQTVHFHVDASLHHWYLGDFNEGSDCAVPVIASNTAPTITWIVAPENASVGEYFNIQARGNDADGNLVSVSVFREGMPHALNDGGDGSEKYSDLNGSSLDHPGTVTFTAQAQDSNGASSELIYHTVHVYQPNRSPDSPAIFSGGVTQINLGESVSITGTIHDPDGNLSYHNLWVSPPVGGWTPFLSGSPSDQTQSWITGSYTPDSLGTWQFHTNGWDGAAWGPGATLAIYVVDGTPPSIPAGLSSSDITGSTFTLNWGASNDNVGVTLFEVRRDSSFLGTAGATSMTISGLAQGTVYTMTVRARDAAGNWSDWSAPLVVQTVDTQPPSVPTGLSASSIGPTGFTLTWSASSDNLGATAYEVMNGAFSLGTTPNTFLSINGLTPGTTYSLTVRSFDGSGNGSSWSAPLTVATTDTQPPSIPVGLTSSGMSANSFVLTWSASSDNVGVTAYEVFREGASLGITMGTSMSIGGLSPGTAYGMTARARDAALNWSALSAVLIVTTAPADGITDTDGDGIPDVIEQQLGTDPHSSRQDDSGNQSALKIHRPNP